MQCKRRWAHDVSQSTLRHAAGSAVYQTGNVPEVPMPALSQQAVSIRA